MQSSSKIFGFSLFFRLINCVYLLASIMICLNASQSTPFEKQANSFKLILNKDDPFRISQDFVKVGQVLSCEDSKHETCVYSGVIPLRSAMDGCANSGVFTNLFVATNTSQEFMETLVNITHQATILKMGNHQHLYCRVFMFLQSCNSTVIQSLGRNDFFGGNSNDTISLPFNWNSDLYVMQYCRNTRELNIWEVYSVKNVIFTNLLANQSEKRQDVVSINMTDLLLEHSNNPKVVRRQDLKGVQVTAAAFLNKDDENDNLFEIKVGKGKDGEDTFEDGMSVSIFTDFRIALNFAPKFLKIYFNLENYFETGFLSDSYPFDINLYHAGVTRNRTRVAQPLHPTYFDGVHAIFVQPSDSSVRNIYRKPFELQMWSVLFYTWTFIWISCKLTMYLNTKLDLFATKENYILEMDTVSNFESLLWCMGTICQQGWHTIPSFTPTRLVILTSLFFSVISYAAYTGKIVSELYYVPKPIKTLSHLLSYVEKIYLVSESDTSYDVLEGLDKIAPEILEKIRFRSVDHIYKKLVAKPGKDCTIAWPDTFNDHVENLLMQENPGGGYSVEAFLCDTFTTYSFQPSSSLFIPLASELEQLFNYRIIIGLEKGYIRRYWNTYNRNTKLYCLSANPKVTALGFGHVFFAFFALWFGMVLCGMFLVFEILLFRISFKIPVI